MRNGTRGKVNRTQLLCLEESEAYHCITLLLCGMFDNHTCCGHVILHEDRVVPHRWRVLPLLAYLELVSEISLFGIPLEMGFLGYPQPW